MKEQSKTKQTLIQKKTSLADALEYAENIINTVREPLVVLDQDLRVVTASRSFYEFFKVKSEETVGQLIYNLGDNQWDIPKLRELLENILPRKTTFDNYEVEHEFATIGRRIMLLNARQIQRVSGKERIILLAIEDITERKRLEDILTKSEELFRGVFRTASDGIVLLEKREGKITHINPAAEKMLGSFSKESIGKKLQDIGFMLDMDDFQTIMQNLNKSGIINYTDVSVTTKSGQNMHTDVYLVDKTIAVQCNIRDITERKRMEESLKKTTEEMNWLFKSMINAFGIFESIFDDNGYFVSYRFVYINDAYESITGVKNDETIGKTVHEVWPETEPEWIKRYGEVAVTGVTQKFDLYHDPTKKFYHCNVYRPWDTKDRFCVIFEDITEHKRAEINLKDNLLFLQTLIDTIPNPLFYKDRKGEYLSVNRAFEEFYGINKEEIIGKNVYDMGPKHISDKYHEKDQELFQFLGKQTYEWKVVNTAGKTRNVIFNKASYTDQEGTVTGLIGVITDITERKQAEAELRRSEENFRRSLDDSPLGVRIVTAEGETIYANRVILDFYGYDSIEELKTSPVEKRYTKESFAEYQIRQEKRKRGDYDPSEYDISIIRKNGEVRHLQVFRKEVLWNGARQSQVVYQDITARKEAEEALQKSTQLLDKTMSSLLDAVFIIDADTVEIVDCNPAASAIFGYSRQEMLGQTTAFLHMNQASMEEFRQHLNSDMEAAKDFMFLPEYRMKHKDGKVFFSEHSVVPLKNKQGRRIGWVSVVRDITERKKAEEALLHSREQMRSLSNRLQMAREEERTRIARKIHDEIGGLLTGLKIDLSLLLRTSLEMEDKTIKKSLLDGIEGMIKSIDVSVPEIRRLAMELRPVVLDELGFVAAIEWHLHDFQKRTGINCQWISSVEYINLDINLSTALFRIFQEALTNVARHSEATEVRAYLRAGEESFVLEVEDNGKGFEKENLLNSEALGFMGMKERAQMFEGSVTITGKPGMGTKVTINIPSMLKRKPDQEGDAG